MTKPKVSKTGSTWWVDWTETHLGQVVQKAQPFGEGKWVRALNFALGLAERGRA